MTDFAAFLEAIARSSPNSAPGSMRRARPSRGSRRGRDPPTRPSRNSSLGGESPLIPNHREFPNLYAQDGPSHGRRSPYPYLRHHPARRRAIARREHEPGREARGRPGACGPGRGHHRGGVPDRLAGDFEAVRAIATEVTGSTICGLARCNEQDIDRAWEAVKYAQKPRIHVFLATSAIHREHKLQDDHARRSIERAVRQRRAGQGRTAPTSSSAPRTPPAPSSTSSARWSRRPSTPGRPR